MIFKLNLMLLSMLILMLILMLVLMISIVTMSNLQDHMVASVGAADHWSRRAGRVCTELSFLQKLGKYRRRNKYRSLEEMDPENLH